MQQSWLCDEAGSLEFDLENVGTKNYLTHNFHPYPAKFIPQIPAKILDHYARPGAVILDPFCGSGTVAVEATLRGYHCIANDINPIATLITAAKTTTLTEADKRELRQLLYDLASSPLLASPADIPVFKNRDLWFSGEMLQELGAIRRRLETLTEGSGAAILADCAFSAIVVRCSNQESETHWRSVNKSLKVGFAVESYGAKLRDMIDRSVNYSNAKTGTCDVQTGTALALDVLPDATVDLVVTSPPYANSHDYYLYNKLRMFWLGHDHYSVQTTEIGSRHRHSDLKEPIENYLAEMQAALREMVRVLKDDGVIAIVIGDSVYRSGLVDMGYEYTELAVNVGLEKIYHYDFDQRRYTSAFQRGLKTLPKRSHIMAFRK